MENLLLNPHLKSAPSALILDADLVNVVANFIAFLTHLSPISMGLIRARLPDAESRIIFFPYCGFEIHSGKNL